MVWTLAGKEKVKGSVCKTLLSSAYSTLTDWRGEMGRRRRVTQPSREEGVSPGGMSRVHLPLCLLPSPPLVPTLHNKSSLCSGRGGRIGLPSLQWVTILILLFRVNSGT